MSQHVTFEKQQYLTDNIKKIVLSSAIHQSISRAGFDQGTAVLPEGGAHNVATASTHEMIRSVVGAGVGCSILNMIPAAETTYAGNGVVGIPIRSAERPLRLALGHLGGKPRRLVQAVSKAIKQYFTQSAATRLIVPLEDS